MARRARPSHDESDDDAAARREALSTSESGAPNSLVVGLDCRSMNVYRFLRVRFPRVPHGELRRWLAEELVTVNGTPVADSRPLRFGDVVEVDADVERPARRAKAEVARLDVLYEDEAMVALDKPSGLATAGEHESKRPHLLGTLTTARPGGHVKLVHRIDKHASGVVVFAFGRANQSALQQEFQARRVVKDYVALVSGHVEPEPQLICARLVARLGRVSRMVVAEKRGKLAVTLVRGVLRFRGHTLVHARPVSGRTHQIRVHLQHVGHSLVADPLYGGEERLLLSDLKLDYRRARGEQERPLLERLALHALRIRLTSPATGATVVCGAPLPKDLRSALRQLQKSAGTRTVADLDAFLADPSATSDGVDPFAELTPKALELLAVPS
jgi:RluA family pseudouridine synthase